MFNKFYQWIGENIVSWIVTILCFGLLAMSFIQINKATNTVEYKDFKDGIQNHLVWSIKGECFFVRPQTELTVHLVRVADCDKK
jgi:hypothetical protein